MYEWLPIVNFYVKKLKACVKKRKEKKIQICKPSIFFLRSKITSKRMKIEQILLKLHNEMKALNKNNAN
jgi:hypothetical protein